MRSEIVRDILRNTPKHLELYLRLKNIIFTRVKETARIIKFLILFIRLLGTPSWNIVIDKPNLYQYLYKWRMGLKTSWEVAKILRLK